MLKKLNSKSVEQKDFRMVIPIEEKHEEAFEQSHSYSLCYPKEVPSPTTTTHILFDSPADIDRYFYQLKNMGFIFYYKVRPGENSNELIASYVLPHEEKSREVLIFKVQKFLKFPN